MEPLRVRFVLPNLDIRAAGYSDKLARCIRLALRIDEGRRT